MAKIRWGLLSTANINKRLIPAIRASRRGELVGVASRNLDNAQRYAASWEIPQAFGGYQEMLMSDTIDAVYIGLPNHLHAEWSIAAMKTGKHVLCEKPLALSTEEVDQMSAVSQETGCVLAEAFMYLHHPQTEIVSEWVRSGRMGEISAVRAVFNFRLTNPQNIRLIPEYGGGCLWDVGVYPVSFSQYVMGETPEWVFGDQWLGTSGVDETFVGQLHYAGGQLAQISSSFRTPYYTYAEISGTEGTLTLTQPFTVWGNLQRVTFQTQDEEPMEIDIPKKELYLGEVEDMHVAILDGAPSKLPLAKSRDHIKTVTALYNSAQKRAPVHINPIS